MREPGAGVLSYQQYAIRIKRYGGCIRFIVLLYQKNEAPQKRGFSCVLELSYFCCFIEKIKNTAGIRISFFKFYVVLFSQLQKLTDCIEIA